MPNPLPGNREVLPWGPRQVLLGVLGALAALVAVAGGDSIRCAPYATFGSPVLAGYVLDALQRRKACLLANHGQLSFGRDLEEAVELARWVEELAKQYWIALQVGEPVILSASEMEEVIKKFETFGQLPAAD